MRCLRMFAFLACTSAFVAGGCSLEQNLTGPEPETGPGLVYGLSEVNASAIPVVLSPGPPKVEVLRGALTLSPDSTWIVSLIFRLTGPGSTSVESATNRGKYSRQNVEITLTLAGSTTTQYRGSWSSSEVQLIDMASTAAERFRFRRP